MEHRLAAILALDVTRYNCLMEQDEASALAALKFWYTEILQPAVSKHHCRVVFLRGDKALTNFSRAVNAAGSAVERKDLLVELSG